MGTDLHRALELDCPIPSRLSPHADTADERLLEWLARFGPPLDEGARSKLARGRFARYAGRLYPDTGPIELSCLAVLFTWFFLLDDACDGSDAPGPARVATLRDEVLRLLRGGAVPPRTGTATATATATKAATTTTTTTATTTATGGLLEMLAEAWRLPRQRMPVRWRLRFIDAVAHHLDGVLVEASNKAIGHRPTVAEYVTLRRATSAAYVSYAWIEFATGQPVPDAVYHHPAVQRVADAGNDLLSWFNDLISLERDQDTAGGHNLVLAVAREKGLPVPAAAAAVVRRWQARMREFTEFRAAVPSFDPTIDEALRQHLDGIGYSVRGTIDWSLESGRYRPVQRSGPQV